MNPWYLGLFCLLSMVLLARFVYSWPDGKLRYIQCDVGQGDAILITHGFSQILVDGGKNSRVLECLDQFVPFWDRTLSLVVATHADADHIGGLDEVVNKYRVKQFVWNGEGDSSSPWQELEDELSDSPTRKEAVNQGSIIMIQDVKIETLWPIKKAISIDKSIHKSFHNSRQSPRESASENWENTNDESVVLRLGYGSFSILLTGDISTEVEAILARELDLSSLVLKVSHHGSRFSTSPTFLEEVNPQIATIGVGKNSYGHPHGTVIDRLNTNDIEIYRNDQQGDIVITTDGRSYTVTTDK